MTSTPSGSRTVDEAADQGQGSAATDGHSATAEAVSTDRLDQLEASRWTPDPPATGSADLTIRDRIRLQALLLASTGSRWKIDHLLQRADGLEESNRATVQRTLRAMTAQDLLSHSPGAPIYEAGPLLEGIAEELSTHTDATSDA